MNQKLPARIVPLLYFAVAPPFALPIRWLQEFVVTAWAFAVPALATGFALNGYALVAAGGWALAAAVAASAIGVAAVARPALPVFRQRTAAAS